MSIRTKMIQVCPRNSGACQKGRVGAPPAGWLACPAASSVRARAVCSGAQHLWMVISVHTYLVMDRSALD